MQPRTRIKICGITRPQDARVAGELGADAIGLNFFRGSPRHVSVEKAATIREACPPFLQLVGVFVGEPASSVRETALRAGLAAVQLHKEEPASDVTALAPLPVIRAFAWKGQSTAEEIDRFLADCRQLGRLPAAILIDTHRKDQLGGTGESWSWNEAAGWTPPLPVLLAGGLHPENVAAAIRALRPWAVDVASGVESAPGVKDREKMARFIQAVRQADADA